MNHKLVCVETGTTVYKSIWVTDDPFPSVPKKKEDPVKDEPEKDKAESASEDEGGTEKQAAPKKGYELPRAASYFGGVA